jgi:hypothetical protein
LRQNLHYLDPKSGSKREELAIILDSTLMQNRKNVPRANRKINKKYLEGMKRTKTGKEHKAKRRMRI